MSVVAILGAGSLGASLARTLARRDRVTEVRLIDPMGDIASGKALDLQQSGPIDGFRTRIVGSGDSSRAIGVPVIVVADRVGAGGKDEELVGESALRLLQPLLAVDSTSMLVFAGANQRSTMVDAVRDLRLDGRRLLGTAPEALRSALGALIALDLDLPPAAVAISILGLPPARAVITWSDATVAGTNLEQLLTPSRIAAFNALIPRLWPMGPYVLASAAARACEALAGVGRHVLNGFAVLDDKTGRPGEIAAVPVIVHAGQMMTMLPSSLSVQERVALESSFD